MQTSDKQEKTRQHKTDAQHTAQPLHWLRVYGVMLAAAAVLVWFGHAPINAYWQQTYHRTSPLEPLNRYALWQEGEKWQSRAYDRYRDFLDRIAVWDGQWQSHMQPVMAAVSDSPATAAVGAKSVSDSHAQPNAAIQQNTAAPPVADNAAASHPAATSANTDISGSPTPPADEHTVPQASAQYVTLHNGDTVFFAGDSLMQGIAPHIQRWLKQQYNIDSVNLSKQSTGLSYPSFFDWPATIEKTINKNKKIKLLLVFLGPNDPWDFPNPAKPAGPYLKFRSDAWQQEYQKRVGRIIQAARRADVQIIWLGAPYMKSKKLNEQMKYLNNVLYRTTAGQVLWLPTDVVLSNGQTEYADAVEQNGRSVRLRSKDGIHFSLKGQQFLAEYVQDYIRFQAAAQTAVAASAPAAPNAQRKGTD